MTRDWEPACEAGAFDEVGNIDLAVSRGPALNAAFFPSAGDGLGSATIDSWIRNADKAAPVDPTGPFPHAKTKCN